MPVRDKTTWLLLALLLLLAACAPPAGLPSGPTPIPTLIPVDDFGTSTQATSTPSFTIQSYPARPPSATDGERIYQARCSECHGADGTGSVPGARNFRDLDYMRGETPADFYAAVTEGRGEMPAYQETLSSDERWDVVFYIWRLSTTGETLRIGQQLYDQNCASCHGQDGSGQLLGSADFTNLRQMDSLAPRDLYLTLTQGRGSMPAWQSILSQDQRWATIDYLRSFTYDATLAGEVAPTSEPAAPPTQRAACNSSQANPVAWDDPQVIQAGESLYRSRCAGCHGQEASGGLPNTPDFTLAATSEELRGAPGSAMCAILEGKGVMPAFADLTLEQAGQLISYLASLGK